MSSIQVLELVSGLKSRNAENRRKAARALYYFAKTELREMPEDKLTQTLDEFNHHIHDMISSNDANDKRAGILTIVCLIGGDTETTKTRTTRYTHYLRNIFPSSDLGVLELAAKTMSRLAASLGVKRSEYIEFEIRKCFEWLIEDRNEGKRLSAVLILKEFAVAMPSYFYQQINGFFDHILIALRDPKAQIREAAAKALRAALVVTAQRENSKHSNKAHWYRQCHEDILKPFSDATAREKGLNRDDCVHGNLLILNELLRCSHASWEKKYTNLMQKLDTEQDAADDITSLNTKSCRETPTKKRNGTDPAIFICITLLSFAVKEDVAKEVQELLDPMCTIGLSLLLTTCFKELSINIPSLNKEITDRLLNMLSIILRKKPYKPPGIHTNIDQQIAQMALLVEPHDAAKLVLALRTLGTFDFEWQHSLLSFIRRCTDYYLLSEQQEIRLEAVRTAAKLLLITAERASKCPSRTLTSIIDEAIGKLLTVAITDFDHEVRLRVFETLSEVFDPYLAQIEHLSSLFTAMNDEHLEIRELAICTIGRLCMVNPAYVMPTLRKVLIQFLIEMEHSGLNRNKEQATRIVLKAIGDLADVNGDGNVLTKWMPELIGIQLELLSNSNSSDKRSVALWAFGQLISATGYVITPYIEYPNLMNTLFNFLKTEQNVRDRRETIRVLGLLGALDPYKHKMNRGLIDYEQASSLIPVFDSKPNENEFETNISEMLVNMSPLVLEEFYPAIVIPSLMTILRDSSLNQHHTSVVQAVTFIFQSLGIKCVPYISRVTPSLLYVIRTTENTGFREFLLAQLAKLISIVKQHIRNHLDKIFELIKEFWTPNSPLQTTLIMLVEHIAVALGSEFKIYLPQIMPQILKILCHDVSKDLFVTEKLLLVLQKFEDNLDDYIHLVIPAIVKLFEAKDCPHSVAKLALETIDNMSIYLNVIASSNEPSQTIKKLTVNAQMLRKAWAVNSRVSKDDWLEWLRRLSVGLLSESPSPALRACSSLAHNYPQLASDLFNAAFVSCWTELDDSARNDLVNALEQALTAPAVPELALTVLNLAEFMEHCERGALPISANLLGERAISGRAYAKALYYKEEEYRINPTSQVVEALIHVNNKLQQKEAANGLLETVMTQKNDGNRCLNVQVRWYEKLHNWDQALTLYNKKLEDEPQNIDSKLGQMRCLEALGEWGKLHDVVSTDWPDMNDDMRGKSAKIAAAAAWGLQQWDAMKKYVDCLPEDSQDGAFYRAILAIHDGQWAESRHFVDQARMLLDSELTAVAGESYQRAYAALVNAQLLTELEEVVTYKLVSERRNIIRQAWWTRLQGGQRLVEDWRKILQIHSLVLSPQEDLITWLKFASLCRKNGALGQAHKVLVMLIGCDPSNNPDMPLPMHEPRLTLAYAKHLWVAGEKRLAFDQLQRYVENADSGDVEHCRLLARCHLKLGEWCEALQGITELSLPEVLRNYASATVLAPDWYKAWHAWAYMNFEMVLFYKQQDNVSEGSQTGSSGEKKVSKLEFLHQCTVPAVEAFFQIYKSVTAARQFTSRHFKAVDVMV
ncbi:hypothetical protein EVAR_94949_1 [Eumeta japonica]|uniref:Serine/threonine-protein kinase TOR n=1 Tax=Eumeta variegata TaxID=151549 RepID=A0A4C1UVS9_EUMVA|nr:hypothetical protein EVAR_94949_1 [Eumeta japonica]